MGDHRKLRLPEIDRCASREVAVIAKQCTSKSVTAEKAQKYSWALVRHATLLKRRKGDRMSLEGLWSSHMTQDVLSSYGI